MAEKTQNQSKVSVLIATKNPAEDLRKCITALKKQDYKNLEVIAIDDHSKDHTKQVCEQEGVKYVQNEGKWMAAAFNTGVKQASGEIIATIDDDNIPDVDCISEMVKLLDENTGAVCARIYEDQEPKGLKKIPLFKASRDLQVQLRLKMLDVKHNKPKFINPGNCAVFWTKKLKEIGFWDSNYRRMSDRDTGMRLLKSGYTMKYSQRPITHHHRSTKTRPSCEDFNYTKSYFTIYLYKKNFNLDSLRKKIIFVTLLFVDFLHTSIKALFIDKSIKSTYQIIRGIKDGLNKTYRPPKLQ